MQKNDFFVKRSLLKNYHTEFFQQRTMWKLTSGQFRKCISYEACGEFYTSYHCSKSTHGWKSESVTIIMRCKKKDTATILRITAWNWISVETTMLMSHWFNFRAQNSKLWPCLFFWTPPLLRFFFFHFHPTLTANNSGLKPSKLKNYNIFGIARTLAFSWYHPI